MIRFRFRIRKQTVWRTHSVLGLVAGLGLLVIGLSGSILMFSKEIDALLRPGEVRVDPGGRSRLPFDELIAGVARNFPGHELTGWALHPADPGASDQVWMQQDGEDEHWVFAHLDPYTGRILSRPAESGDHLTGWLLELHYSFFADHAGLLLAGLLAVMLMLLGLTGLWLYRDFFTNFFRLRWKSSARILFSDLHKFVGIHSVVFNLILGFTGGWWNLSHLIGHLYEEEADPAADTRPALPVSRWASVDAMIAASDEKVPGFITHYLTLPRREGDNLVLYGRHADAGPFRGLYGSSVTFEPISGESTEHSDLREASAWAQVYDSFMPLHYGTFGGWPIRILWCLGGLAPGVLAVSGFLIWRSRHRKRPASSGSAMSSEG